VMADIERDERAPALATPEWKAGLNGNWDCVEVGTAWNCQGREIWDGVEPLTAWNKKGAELLTAWNMKCAGRLHGSARAGERGWA
jgi:hypothetical protein